MPPHIAVPVSVGTEPRRERPRLRRAQTAPRPFGVVHVSVPSVQGRAVKSGRPGRGILAIVADRMRVLSDQNAFLITRRCAYTIAYMSRGLRCDRLA